MKTFKILGELERLVADAVKLIPFDTGDITGPESNPATQADRAIHSFLSRRLPRLIDAPVVSEEGSLSHPPDSQYMWVVDPLDGTLNFIAGAGDFAVSVALVRVSDRRPEIGVVLEPERNISYGAVVGLGAWRNGTPFSARHPASNILAIGMPSLAQGAARQLGATVADLLDAGWILRQTGSAALDICRAAEGIWSGFYEPAVMLWDIAAAMLVAEEAGLEIRSAPASVEAANTPWALDFLAINARGVDASHLLDRLYETTGL